MRVASHAAINGFEGVSAAELHTAAGVFSDWDLDRDGVLKPAEFAQVVNSLALYAGRAMEAETVARLFALLDRDANGAVDFNEFLAVHKQLLTDDGTSDEGSAEDRAATESSSRSCSS